MDKFSFYLVTDTHYFDNSYKRSGEAYERRSRTDQKCVAETPAIIDAGFAQLAKDKETDVILIPGDLIYRGEYQSHVGFRERLYRLKEQGKRIYLITARHDYDSGDSFEFEGDKMIPVKGMPREELREFYKDFGFDEAISEHKETMSYVIQLTHGIRLLALNCDGDLKDFKGIFDNQLEWALNEVKNAHDSGNYIFAMTHFPLLPFSPIMNLVGDAHLTDWEKVATALADAGVDLIFTGHMHAQSVTEYKTENGNTITDVQTGCFVGCPCAYRKITFEDRNTVNIKSYTINNFDYDKGGRTAQEYFKWRFDRMIEVKMHEILPKPAMKAVDKLTVKKIGRLLCFKPDKSVENRLAKDVGVELVRNIFMGDEPYTKSTPMYETMSKMLKRLHPITHIIEIKMKDKNPILADLDTFILSMIGDENQRDNNAVLKINKNNY